MSTPEALTKMINNLRKNLEVFGPGSLDLNSLVIPDLLKQTLEGVEFLLFNEMVNVEEKKELKKP